VDDGAGRRPFPTVHVIGFFALWGGLGDVLFDAPSGAARHVVVAYLLRGLMAGAVAGYFIARGLRQSWHG
jgi:hypothetical protein